MGNVSRAGSLRHLPGSARKDVPYEEIQKMIEDYKEPSVDKFSEIAEKAKRCYNLEEEYNVWRIASMYHFMTTLDVEEHDIGQSQSEILCKFQNQEARIFEDLKSIDVAKKIKAEKCMYYLYKATNNDKYLLKKSSPRKSPGRSLKKSRGSNKSPRRHNVSHSSLHNSSCSDPSVDSKSAPSMDMKYINAQLTDVKVENAEL